MKGVLIGSVAFLFVVFPFNAQEKDNGTFTGNIESVFQYLNEDTVIGANQPPSKGLLNSYMNVFYTNSGFKAGMIDVKQMLITHK